MNLPHPNPPPHAGEGGARSAWAGATIGGAIDNIAGALAGAGFVEPRREARRLLAAALDLSPAEIFAHPERALTATAQARLADFQRRMVAHEPLSRIAGRREFWGMDFLLSADTLDPRPDSETLVEAVLGRRPDRQAPLRILDLGCGTGCLLMALLSEYPNAGGFGVDIAPGAARTARENARRFGFDERSHFVVAHWVAALRGPFDIIVANPPYIASEQLAALPAEVRDHDPHRALDGGIDGLAAYRAIAAELARLLTPGGIFATEIGRGQAEAVAAIIGDASLDIDGVERDLAGIERVVVARRARA